MIVLVSLIGVFSYLVYQRGFGLQLGAPPSTLKTPYHTEEAWIVGEIARDLVRMSAYAAHRESAKAMASDVTVTAVTGAAAQLATYDVRMNLGGDGAAATVRLTLPHGVWTPDDYVPLVREALRALHLSPAPAPAPTPAAEAENPATLVALLDLRPSTIEQQDTAISQRLARHMLDAHAHEEAALLLGTFGLREAANRFSDARETLSRMTAHLAMARACASSPTRYGPSGRYGDVLRLILSNRGADALAGLTALDAPDSQPQAAQPQAAWNRALRMRVTQDWRAAATGGRRSLLERLEYFRARTATIPSPAVLEELDAMEPESIADWGRITLQSGFSVQAGQRFAKGQLRAELDEIDEIWRATHDTPRMPAIATALNNRETGCLTASGPRVVAWGAWARFFERHLANQVTRLDHFLRVSLGLREAADAEKMVMDRRFGDLDLYPVASCWRKHGPRSDEADFSRVAEAIRVTIRAPELITAGNWAQLELGAKYEMIPVGMPKATAWFLPASADRMPYDAGPRTDLDRPQPSAAEREAMLAVSPYDRSLALWHANLQRPALKEPADRLALIARIMQPRIDYDVRARTAVEEVITDGEAWRAHRVRTCELATEYCMGLAASLGDAGHDVEAAALYQRVFDDHTVDRVDVANNSLWLVKYYHRTGRAKQALAVANSAGRVGSSGGLLALAWLMERTGDFARAGELYEQNAERYDRPQGAIAFYYRMARVRGDKDYEAALAAWIPRLFPHGLERIDTALVKAAPKNAVYVMSQTEAARKADIRPADLIIALDGWRTETLQQYETVRAFQEDGALDLTIWRDGVIQRKAKADKYRRLGIELRTFPFSGWTG